MNSIKAFGKFLDQPILISKLDKTMPKLVSAAAIGKVGYDCYKNYKNTKDLPEEEKKQHNKDLMKKSIVTASVVASAVSAPRIASFFTKRQPIEKLDTVVKRASSLVDEFTSEHNDIDSKTSEILTKAKDKVLSYSQVKNLSEKLDKIQGGSDLFEKLIPEPQNIKAKDIFSEIGYLSVYGAVPVVGGIAGGVASDITAKDDYKKNLPDKVSEGVYQYLANIFMCNIGAGAALGILEKLNIKSKLARVVGMTSGIILTGIVGGSKAANFITEKLINPIISPDKKIKERKPEAMDMCMHTDDIATVSVLSGLKWIEPSLPILYSVSGYKAGTGYRN